ncbi:MAG: VWA domain-containing protein [Chitinophagaceae bacterium]|nr:VWA domain-containing protein [Chitinophagaceae bacterium]
MVRFEHIEHLLLLLLVPIIILLFNSMLRWKKATTKKIGDEKLVKQLTNNFSPARHLFRFITMLGAFVLLITGAANLQSATQIESIKRQGIDIMIALDVSRSMVAEDIKPSRLERARQLINKLMDRLQDDRIGLVIFAGRAYMQMPLTSDHTAAKLYVNNAGPDAVPAQGTVISEALRLCNSGFNGKEKKYKSILLITDGEDHDENALKVSKALAENGVIINTIGVGTTQGAPILNAITHESKRDLQGNIILSKLNEQELMDISHETNGIYQQLNDVDAAVDKLIAQYAGMEQKTIQDTSLLSFRSFFQWFLALALIALTGELFISDKKKLKS